MIQVSNISVVKSGIHLFKNLNWRIDEGEHWVIQGDNGNGKSILLEVLAGTVHIPEGTVVYDFIKGETWEERFQERKNKISFIPTQAIQSFLTGIPNLYYQQRYYASNETTATVRSVLGDDLDKLRSLQIPVHFDITRWLDVELTRLSNGQLKKVLILKHFAHQIPKLLLLDYPFEGLDRESRKELSDFLDFITDRYSVQIILTDHHHQLPKVINRRLVLRDFNIHKQERVHDTKVNEGGGHFKTSLPTQTKGEPVVEMKNVTIQYGDSVILEDFNWMVRKGERWALVGENGSGKTTLFSLIYADHPMAYSRPVYLFGKRRGTGESIWDIKARINYMGPELISYMYPKGISMTALDYIRDIHPHARETDLQNLVNFFQAEAFIHKPVKFLSSGQLQLMLLINCFLDEKELLLLDEPFQFLSPGKKALVQEYIESHLPCWKTLILITHYDEDIVKWTQHVMKI